MKDLRKLFSLQDHQENEEATNVAAKDAFPQVRIEMAFFTDIGCAAWKLRQKVFNQETGEPNEELRPLARHVSVICDRLSELGLQIQDHTGDSFDSGQSLEVLAFQPTDGITGETVLETVRPTIYFSGRRILMGQVIVGTPATDPSSQGRL
jgi:hypothetical protein